MEQTSRLGPWNCPCAILTLFPLLGDHGNRLMMQAEPQDGRSLVSELLLRDKLLANQKHLIKLDMSKKQTCIY